MTPITYTNKRGTWTLYETKILLRGGKYSTIQCFFLPERPPINKNWKLASSLKSGFEIYENERIQVPQIRKLTNG